MIHLRTIMQESSIGLLLHGGMMILGGTMCDTRKGERKKMKQLFGLC